MQAARQLHRVIVPIAVLMKECFPTAVQQDALADLGEALDIGCQHIKAQDSGQGGFTT